MRATAHHLHRDPQAARLALNARDRDERRERDNRRRRQLHLHLVGRVLMAGVFLFSAVAKLLAFDATARAMAATGLHDVELLLGLAIGLELVGGAALAAGYKVRAVAVGLIAYVATVTLLMHGDFAVAANRSFALANVAFVGGLMLLISHGAGELSADAGLARRDARRYGL